MKNIFVLAIWVVLSTALQAQTMKWVPLPAGTTLDQCVCTATAKSKDHCYALAYTPAVSGTLTSYTTGFLISCTSLGSPIQKNVSCSMTNKLGLIEDCKGTGQILFNSSGNSGSPVQNKIQKGLPVYLHQVCFQIPEGESVTIAEEQLTDLTTSIDLGNGQVATEAPEYITQVIGKPKADQAQLTSFLDFKARPLDHLVAQLDWSIQHQDGTTQFVIEHGVDGVQFVQIDALNAKEGSGKIESYSFTHPQALEGYNFYRLKMYDAKGTFTYSPIRVVNFSGDDFSMKAWPSPVSDVLNVYVNHATEAGHMLLMDLNGRVMSDTEFTDGDSFSQIQVATITSGLYTLIVQSANKKQEQKIVIVE